MKIYLSPDVVDGGGDRIVVSEKPATSERHPDNNPQFKEGSMPDSLKGQEIDFSGSEPDLKPLSGDTTKIEDEVPAGDEAAQEFAQEKLKKDEPVKKGELPKLPEITPAEKKEVKPVDQQQTKPGEKVVAEIPKGARDYSIFSPEEQKLFKATNNQTFAAIEALKKNELKLKADFESTTKKLSEIAANPNAIPTDWYNSPDAYILHPEFQQTLGTLNKAQTEAQFYQQQLVAIESGEEFQVIRGYNSKTGEMVLSDPIKPTPQAKVGVADLMNKASNLASQYQAQANQFQNNFKQRYQQAVSYTEKVLEERWPWHKDPNDPRQLRVKEFYTAVPLEFQNHPCTRIAAHMWQTIFELADRIKQGEGKQAVAATVKKIQEEVEPAVSSVASPGGERTARRNSGLGVKLPNTVPAVFDLKGMDE